MATLPISIYTNSENAHGSILSVSVGVQDWDIRVSIILLALVLLWGASCSNKMASHWAGKNCCLLFSAVSVCSWSLFNIFYIFIHHHNNLSSPLAPSQHHPFIPLHSSFLHPFVCFILIPHSQPLPSFLAPILLTPCYPSSAGTLPISDAYQLAFTVNEIHHLFLSFSRPLNSTFFLIIQHSSILCLWLPGIIIYSSCLCSALWEFVRAYLTYD